MDPRATDKRKKKQELWLISQHKRSMKLKNSINLKESKKGKNNR